VAKPTQVNALMNQQTVAIAEDTKPARLAGSLSEGSPKILAKLKAKAITIGIMNMTRLTPSIISSPLDFLNCLLLHPRF
jgi:hypothetical protein